MEEESSLSIPRDAEQVAAEQGEVTEAQRLANEQLERQIREREAKAQQQTTTQRQQGGSLMNRIRQAQLARAGAGGK